MRNLQLQEAKARFSQVVKSVINEGPCEVTLHGKPAVVILSKEEYDALSHPKNSLVEFLQTAPFDADDLDINRDQSLMRDIDL